MSTVKRAKLYAEEAHAGQMYGPYPYTKHLNDVYNVLVTFGISDSLTLMAGWLHDTIEDTQRIYEDLFEDFGKRTADVVYLLSDKRGRNRVERHKATYPLIAESGRATVVKCADRLANVMNSQHDREKSFFMYEKEQPYFKETLLKNIETEEFAPYANVIVQIMDRIDTLLAAGPHLEM